ncbi:NADH dehydrogenase [ubiquinone] iron-sulfur protein 6, mitochondrial isoform X2 [Callithrix jacchus]
MAATVTFCRLLCRSGAAARSLPLGARCFGVQISPTGEKITHTGQVYDEKDYRRLRFVGRQKEVPVDLPLCLSFSLENVFVRAPRSFPLSSPRGWSLLTASPPCW